MIDLAIGLQGYYRLTAHKLDGSSRVVADWFPNLVLDNGLNLIGTQSNILAGAYVGTGNSAPNAAQNALDSALPGAFAGVQTQDVGSDVPGGYCWSRTTFRFPLGQAAGNLSEVGVGIAAGNLFSRALILNGSGTPTTVTVLADEILDVTYEARLYWPSADATGPITIPGVGTSTFTVRPYNVGAWRPGFLLGGIGGNQTMFGWGWSDVTDMGATTDTAFGNGTPRDNTATWTWSAYTPGSFARTGQSEFPIGGAGQPFNGVMIYNGVSSFAFKCLYGAPIPKTSANRLRLSFEFTWARRT